MEEVRDIGGWRFIRMDTQGEPAHRGYRPMNFGEWNQTLGEAFLNEGPNRPVYLSATDAELQRISDRLGLEMEDAADDLQAAVKPYSFLSFGQKHFEWQRSRTGDLPPWLPYLAASTVVVDRQTESGSTAFYKPLSDFLNQRHKITQHEYEDTFSVWWYSLKRWLEDDDCNAGRRGFATWGSIPPNGARSVIGHPYTQVLLRREERKQIDEFLAEFDLLDTEPPTARDRQAVARQLVDALRRWVRDRHAVSQRLRKVLERSDNDDTLSLGYVLLDRLFDEMSGEQRDETATRTIRLAPAYDDYEGVLRLVAVAPNWVGQGQQVTVPHADDRLTGPGDVVALDLALTDEMLREGIDLGDDPLARLVECHRYVMAAREWALWCAVEGALPGEELHLLLGLSEATRLGLTPISGVKGVPAGWAICGPLTLADLPKRLADTITASRRQLVPRLRGGLKLQSRMYLAGGEPSLELGGFDGDITIDGRTQNIDGDCVELRARNMLVGEHKIEVGGFELEFHTVESLQLVDARPSLGRNAVGDVVPVDASHEVLTGARLFPQYQSATHRGLFPFVDRFIKLGEPGEIGVVEDPTMAKWAQAVGLPHASIEVYPRSTYSDGDRLVAVPRWIAWQRGGTWVLAANPGTDFKRDEDAPNNPRAWKGICEEIGDRPEVWTGWSQEPAENVLDRWRAYRDSEVID